MGSETALLVAEDVERRDRRMPEDAVPGGAYLVVAMGMRRLVGRRGRHKVIGILIPSSVDRRAGGFESERFCSANMRRD